jgi:hypothetical protein
MDIKRAKELIGQLTTLLDEIDEKKIYELNRLTEVHQTEITVKVMGILNELDIRPRKYGD